ncbi:DDE family transposase [Rhizobium mongolense USDA 1844]|uniref:DDE family transposase n=1 Tax=Rhizobium mongolense USDA 1844 TaxID=1079460 RepID=A0A559TJE2_9HYPH|nr:DDE family transposase [Rhizobium mongolense USDA 1844]
MPHTFNADRRDKIAKQKYQVTNWPAYNESLRQRGDLTIWVKDEALSLWTARRRTSRGGQPKYSDLAITLCLTLRVVYGLALRQTQGLMRSVAALMGFDIAVPDFSTLSRRSKGLALPSTKSRATTSGPVHLVVDSTGLKVFGEGEWLENKHKAKAKRKRWRKLHLGLNLVSGEIVCSDLTVDDVGDPTALPGLLDQIGGPVEKFIADGAYGRFRCSCQLTPCPRQRAQVCWSRCREASPTRGHPRSFLAFLHHRVVRKGDRKSIPAPSWAQQSRNANWWMQQPRRRQPTSSARRAATAS